MVKYNPLFSTMLPGALSRKVGTGSPSQLCWPHLIISEASKAGWENATKQQIIAFHCFRSMRKRYSIRRSLVNVIWLLSCWSLPVWGESLKIEKVTGENSLLLSDKREFVLRHIEIGYPQIPSLEIAKIDIIDHADRYGRTPAFLFLSDGEELSRYLLKMGLAKLHPREGEPLMEPIYLLLEETARTQKIGLWGEDIHRIKKAGETGLKRYIGFYQFIEGKITNLEQFGKRQEITLDHKVKIRIDENAKATGDSADLADFVPLIGQRVAIRGWLGDFHGMIVNIERIDQIELLP